MLNTVLRGSDVGIVSTVIHEILHNTLFLSGEVAFNESFASFVGDRGAIEFLCARDGESAETCMTARAEWDDNLVFGAFLSALVDDLERLYGRADLDADAKIRMREAIFDAARNDFVADVEPRLRTRAFRGFDRRPLNNATLIGIRLYYRRLDLFEEAWRRGGRDLVRSIRAIRDATSAGGDPFLAVEKLVASLPADTTSD